MGSIIEMAARNELMRRDGRHSANEFLGKIEERLVRGIEADADRADAIESKPPATWSTLAPNASGTESSAWIPAARTRKGGDE
jgi:hypothetical protein